MSEWQWQPIESAPKDGTRVMLWRHKIGDKGSARYEVGYWHQPTNPEYQGFWSCGGIVTHWMLPEPPK